MHMRDTVYFLVFDGYADWQAALALCEIARPGDWRLRTVGFSTRPVTSMGGLQVRPELSLGEIEPAAAAMAILPGGSYWERGEEDLALAAARRLHGAGAVLATIGSATLVPARAGLLGGRRHADAEPGYLARHAPDYRGQAWCDASALAHGDGGLITASAVGGIEFAREVIRALDLYDAGDAALWYRLHRHGQPLPWQAAAPASAAA